MTTTAHQLVVQRLPVSHSQGHPGGALPKGISVTPWKS